MKKTSTHKILKATLTKYEAISMREHEIEAWLADKGFDLSKPIEQETKLDRAEYIFSQRQSRREKK